MNKQKLYKYIGLAFLVIFLILGFINSFYSNQRREISSQLASLSLNKVPGITLDIRIDIPENNFPQVNSLPVYTLLTSNIPQQTANEIANSLRFSPQTKNDFNDVNSGRVNVWFGDDGRLLRIVAGLGIVEYKTTNSEGKTTTGVTISESEAIDIANSFISSNNLLITDLTVGEPDIDYIILEHEGKVITSPENAQFINLNYPLKINNYTIVNDTPGVGSVNVIIDNERQIVSAYINNVPSVDPDGEFDLKNYKEFTNTINQAELQMLDNGNIPIYQVTEDLISHITVNQIDIAYYEEQRSTRKTLQPIYLLNGIARLNDGREVVALLYLSALNNTQE